MDENWWKDLEDLDEDQKGVIGLPIDGSYLVKGPPGCGKTNLLLLRANYMVNSDRPNIAIVVFNRTLQEFIRSGASRYDFEKKNVVTSAHFFGLLLKEIGAKVEKKPLDKARKEQAQIIEEATRGRKPIYDAVFLDEAQDYLPEEITIFRRLCSQLFMVADARQRIYAHDDVSTALAGAAETTVELRFHYRSGRNICELADRVGAKFTAGYTPMLPTSNYNEAAEKSKVEVFQGSIDRQIEEAARRLADQRRVYPKSILGVITPRLEEVRSVATKLADLGLGDLLCVQDSEDGYQPVDPGRPIWVSTIHSAKGLEFRALHMLGMEHAHSFAGAQKRLVFTGITRAKTSLVVYHDGALPPYFAGALAEMRPAAPPKPLGVAFGKK